MRALLLILCAFLLANCQGEPEADEVTGNLMELEPSQLELDGIALEEQPQTVQDFFAVKNELIGDDFCYDYSSLSQLILYGNDSSEEWKKFEVSDNYLTAYHEECSVLLEFMTFELNGEKKAFLSQMNAVSQQFDYLSWNTRTERWGKVNRYPRPDLGDYFDDLSPEENEILNEYGADQIYINPKTSSATYVFSEYAMLMNMGEKQLIEFEEKADYYFELKTGESTLTLTGLPTHANDQLKKTYIVACSVSADPSTTFSDNYEMLLAEMVTEEVQYQITTYSSNDFEVFFPTDTLNIQTPDTDGLTDAFWLFEEGKEPLVIDASQDIGVIIQNAKAYFESED